jgi:hypothetical protein
MEEEGAGRRGVKEKEKKTEDMEKLGQPVLNYLNT